MEWLEVLNAYQVSTPTMTEAAIYAVWVFDPTLPVDEDIDIGLDLPDGDGTDWDYSHLPQATVTFNSAPDLPIEVRILDPPGREDVPVPIGQPVDIPLGAELLITLAEGANPDWFYTWNAPGNMIDGSAEKTERFRLMSGQAISPERRSICGAELPTDPGDGSGYVWEWTGLGPLGHMIAPDESAGSETVYAPQEAHVRLRAYRITEAPPGSGVGDDKKYANVITYQNINDTYTVLGSPTINIARVPLVLGAGIMSHPDHGYLNHMLSAGDGGNAYLSGPNSVGGRLALGGLTTARPAPEASADYVSAYCIPSPGYEPGAWHGDFTVVGPPPNQHHIADATVTYESGATSGGVAFIKKQTLELEVKVEGGNGTPAEAGHLGAGIARKYYSNYGTEHVNLTAQAHTGYYFTGWSGQGVAYLEDEHGDPDFENPVPLDNPQNPITDTSIWIAMGEDWGDGGGAKAAQAGGGRGRAVAGDFEDIGGQLMLDKYVVLPTLRAEDLALLGSEAANEIVTISFWTKYIAPALTVIITCQEDSGGHIQAHHQGNRPMGTLGQPVVEHFTEEPLEDYVVTRYQFTPSEFSGEYIIHVSYVPNEEFLAPIEVRVPGLSELSAGENFELIGEKPSHPDNHYQQSEVLSALPRIAQAYNDETQTTGEVQYNDGSLEFGGRFDINAGWSGSHQSHRVGRQTDVRSLSLSKGAAFQPIVSAEVPGANAVFESNPPHYHINFPCPD